MDEETLIKELQLLTVDESTAIARAGYLIKILYSYELQDYLVNFERCNDHVKSYRQVLEARRTAKQPCDTACGGWTWS
ncbi:hypothetical protein KC887_06230 [Candidatus Kaiserbacteria bacterium]|nr:hypothetical protein [Candidatus Kaiserbacteria bacterium]